MKAKDIRALSKDESVLKLNDLREEYFNLRFQHGVGQLENTTLLKKAKRNIARVKTIIKEKNINN
jgi:large subunit ribosomal protein L29